MLNGCDFNTISTAGEKESLKDVVLKVVEQSKRIKEKAYSAKTTLFGPVPCEAEVKNGKNVDCMESALYGIYSTLSDAEDTLDKLLNAL